MDMKKTVILSVVLMVFMLFPVRAYAQETDTNILNQMYDNADDLGSDLTDAVPDTAKTFIYEITSEDISISSIVKAGPSKFFDGVKIYIKKQMEKPIKIFSVIATIVVICAFAQVCASEFMDSQLSLVFKITSVICLSLSLVSPILDCIKEAAQAMADCSDFMQLLVPTMTSVLTISGQPVTATTYNIMLLAVCRFVSLIAKDFIIPLLSIYLAFSICGCALENKNLTTISSGIKNTVTWVLGFVMCIFAGFLTLQGFVGASADNLSSRAAKFMISSFIPVVGSALSEALTVTKGCMGLIKSTFGVFGSVVVAATFIPISVKTALLYLIITFAGFIGDILGVTSLSNLLKSSANVLSLILSLIFSFAVLTIVTTTLILMMGIGGQ